MATSGIFGWLNIRGLGMEMIVPDEIYCGMATLVTVRLRNEKRLFPSFLLRIKLLGQIVPYALVNRGSAERGSFVHTFTERGSMAIPFGTVSSPFPINFFVRSRGIKINQMVIVFPAPLGCAPTGAAGRGRTSGGPSTARKGFEGEVARISDYTGSEPMKLIHWRLSAKPEAFKVKEMSAASREPVIIDIDELPGGSLEENLSCAVFLINRLIRMRRPVGLKLRERVLAPAVSRRHRLALLGELAVYGKD
ncbi:MAG TPA: DUF58 domain-containing protein [Geobacteraceae bacterium]|nr:DUF58 domain-containing protein [Geobacteraceae bacterium]